MQEIKFWGDYGLFTRPEYKAEPHTYPVLTPSAAKGMLEAIFWKPEFQYVVRRITVLKPIQTLSMQRNMGQKKQSVQTAKKWQNDGGVGRYFIDRDRAQRNHVILRNPAYVVKFNIDTVPHATESVDKYIAQFKRRVDRGQCYKQPFFGCREYPAFFAWATEGDRVDLEKYSELRGDRDLGMLPKALHFIPDQKGKISWRDPATRQYVKGRVVPELFHAHLIDGEMEVE
jgi:CRISPR-associated protein Cas5d